MTRHHPSPSRPAAAPAPQSPAQAAELIDRFGGVIASLLRILDEETQLVRDGRLSELARIEPAKSDLARRYLADAALVRTGGAFLTRELPQQFDALRRRHGEFHERLNANLAVLATVHAVSEGIIRGVAGELGRKAAPQTYGVTGRPAAPRAKAAQPMSLSRTI